MMHPLTRRQYPENTDILTAAGLVHLQMGATSKAFELFGNALTYDARDSKVAALLHSHIMRYQ